MIKKDRIYVEDLRVKGTIGIFDWEKKIKQEISLSYEIDHDNLSASKEDKIEATTDYKTITKKSSPSLKITNSSLLKPLLKKLQKW
jgi:dihydroneopterin aldolase